MESLLHNCHGRIDAIVPDLMACVLMRLETAETKPYKILLYSVLSSAIHYNPALALQVCSSTDPSTLKPSDTLENDIIHDKNLVLRGSTQSFVAVHGPATHDPSVVGVSLHL